MKRRYKIATLLDDRYETAPLLVVRYEILSVALRAGSLVLSN